MLIKRSLKFMSTFEGVDSALDFLVDEKVKGHSIDRNQARVARLARKVLRRQGAYLFGKEGRYGGMDGVIGSDRYGVLVIQGTEPVKVGNRYLALRDSVGGINSDVRLVEAIAPDSSYLTRPTEALVVFGDSTLKPEGVETLTDRHIEAVRLIVTTLSDNLEPVVGSEERDFTLPGVSFYSDFRGGAVLNLRESVPPLVARQ